MSFWKRTREEPDNEDLHLVVGLGNPGGQFARSRHNVGFMVVEALARRYSLSFRSSKLRADVARGAIDGVPVILALPLTYMNESGNAVSRLCTYYRVPVERLVVVCDDIDLPFGTIRVRPGGSSGGNNGLRSIIQALGTQNFPRIRVGVGRPRGNAVSHVLGNFSAEEAKVLPRIVEVAADAVVAVIRSGVQVAMNEFNRDWSE